MKATRNSPRWLPLTLVVVSLSLPASAPGQLSDQERSRVCTMLQDIRDELVENYYDPSFGGLDLEAEYEAALQQIEEASGITQAFGILAQFVAKLKDSHTLFVPPTRVEHVDYGFDMGFVGDTCFVTQVTEGSYAEGTGLQRGDAVLGIGPFEVERQSFPTLRYVLYVLRPQRQVMLTIRRPGGELQQLTIQSKMTQLPVNIDPGEAHILARLRELLPELAEEERHIYVETPDSVLLWKMPSFQAGRSLIDGMIKRARKSQALVLDLRDNSGGPAETALRLIGSLFDHEVVLGQVRTREGMEELVAGPPRSDSFLRQLVVLVNSGSASASEILARTVQLQGRGTVIGDRTAGAVMASRIKVHKVGFGRYWTYATSVSVSDVIMPDGQRLENRGVIPDEVVLPTAEDLRDGRDPAMARALELVGILVDPAAAARVFEQS